MHILSDVIKRWVSRFLSTEPKAQRLDESVDAALKRSEHERQQRMKQRIEDSLRKNGFQKGADGAWFDKEWWTPRNKN